VATQDNPELVPEGNGERETAGSDAAQDQAVVASVDSSDRQRPAKPTDLIDLVDLEQVNKDSIIGVQVPRSENRPGGSGSDPTDMVGHPTFTSVKTRTTYLHIVSPTATDKLDKIGANVFLLCLSFSWFTGNVFSGSD